MYTCIHTRSVNHSVRQPIVIVVRRYASVLRGARDRYLNVRSRIWHQQGIIRLIDCSGGLWWQRSPLRFRCVTQPGTHVLRATGHGVALRQSPGRRLRWRRQDVPSRSQILFIIHMHIIFLIAIGCMPLHYYS